MADRLLAVAEPALGPAGPAEVQRLLQARLDVAAARIASAVALAADEVRTNTA